MPTTHCAFSRRIVKFLLPGTPHLVRHTRGTSSTLSTPLTALFSSAVLGLLRSAQSTASTFSRPLTLSAVARYPTPNSITSLQGSALLARMLSRTSGWTTVQVGRAFSSPAPRRSPLLNPTSIYLTTPWWALWVRTTPAAPTLLRYALSPLELGYRKIRSPVASTLRLRSG